MLVCSLIVVPIVATGDPKSLPSGNSLARAADKTASPLFSYNFWKSFNCSEVSKIFEAVALMRSSGDIPINFFSKPPATSVIFLGCVLLIAVMYASRPSSTPTELM